MPGCYPNSILQRNIKSTLLAVNVRRGRIALPRAGIDSPTRPDSRLPLRRCCLNSSADPFDPCQEARRALWSVEFRHSVGNMGDGDYLQALFICPFSRPKRGSDGAWARRCAELRAWPVATDFPAQKVRTNSFDGLADIPKADLVRRTRQSVTSSNPAR